MIRDPYNKAIDLCIDVMLKKQTIDEYGNQEDPLKAMQQLGIDDLGTFIKGKGIRIKTSTNKKTLLDSAVDSINYAVEIIRRLEK